MKNLRIRMDWALLIRTLFGLSFIVIAFKFNDWMPAVFGGFIIVIGIIAAIYKTGCGYGDTCNH